MYIHSFYHQVHRFIENNRALCAMNLGLAILGNALAYFSGKTFAWLRQCCGIAKKTQDVARHVFNTAPAHQTALYLNENRFKAAFDKTAPFKGYKIALPKGHPLQGLVLTGTNFRPSNLFFQALLGGYGCTTLPGSQQLFAFMAPDAVRDFIKTTAEANPDKVIAFSANNIPAKCHVHNQWYKIHDLADLYGTHTYRQSFQEIQDILDSQKIYLSASIPLPFYKGLKQAMKADQIVILPGHDNFPCLLADLDSFNYPSVSKFLHSVDAHYAHYGFASHQEFEELMKLSLYQLGSQVVKTEDYRIFIDGDGKIRERQPGEKDTVRLINACGIRGIKHHPRQKVNKALMTQTFKTCLQASENGFVLVPAVGMGVWRGNPDLYWRAMLDAVIASNDTFEGILVNPRHSVSSYGRYKGCSGEELQQILDEYLDTYKHDHAVLNKLRKVVNLYDTPKDIAQLAYNLKQAYPHKTISLVNASDPDVTLGYHVGEYVNNIPHTFTTEENYTAMGTNGLCFEDITGVHENPNRIYQLI